MSTPATVRVWESHLALYKRIWRSQLPSSFLQPLAFMLAMGAGVGSLINANEASEAVLGDLPYVAFLAPGLLATTAMLIGSSEASWPVMDGFKWNRGYESQAATPLGIGDVLGGQVLWWATRLLLSSIAVATVLALMSETRSIGLVVGVPAAVLTGLSFALPIAAWAATRESDISFPAIQRFIVTPLFLFGGAFYPIEQLPAGLRPIAYVTPLWHGVELCRGASLHTLGGVEAAVHFGVLGAYIALGWAAAYAAFGRKLHT